MGTSKSEQFSEKQNRLADFSKAISHPARVAIIEHLAEAGPSNCGDIVKVLPLAQPTISQHLKELKEAGLVKDSSVGNTVRYSINTKAFEKFEKRAWSVFKKIKKLKTDV